MMKDNNLTLDEEIALIVNSKLIDPDFYVENNGPSTKNVNDLAKHFCESGWREYNNPNPVFDTKFYLDNNLDVRDSGMNPLLHYILYGRQEGRSIHNESNCDFFDEYEIIKESGFFDIDYYLSKNPGIAKAGIDPLKHFCENGWRECNNPNPVFDTKFYLDNNLDVRDSGMNPLLHYILYGRQEGRSIHNESNCDFFDEYEIIKESGFFDIGYYLSKNPGIAKAGIDPLKHFCENGWKERRQPNSLFDTKFYLDNNLDVRDSGMNPLLHYILYGEDEGRIIDSSKTSIMRHYFQSRFKRPLDLKVSVIVPNYNHAKYLEDRLESILNQTYKNIEIILLDDNSDDDSKEILERFKNKYPEKISCFFNEKTQVMFLSSGGRGLNAVMGT